jgi:SAM-dependent methyltransferase
MVAERFDPTHESDGEESPWGSIHTSRYRFASRFLRAGSVLDISCGTGHGLSLLHRPDGDVIGFDLDFASLQRIRSKEAQCVVACGDAERLPFQDEAFSSVVTLETIEHLEQPDQFLDELWRVISPGGVLVLSTPNALVSPQTGDGLPRNPFHRFEYTPQQCLDAVSRRFRVEGAFGQSLHSAFRISPFEDERRAAASQSVGKRMGELTYRSCYRINGALGRILCKLLLRQPLHPKWSDYVFEPNLLLTAAVTVVVARKPVQ